MNTSERPAPNTGRATPSRDRKAFARMLVQAAALSPDECRRHAMVSRDNRHRCSDCFTCACLTVHEIRVGEEMARALARDERAHQNAVTRERIRRELDGWPPRKA